MTDWPDLLDEFESRVRLAEALLELGAANDAPAPFTPPATPAPIPPALVARAEALLDRAGGVQRRLVEEQARIRTELARLPRVQAAARTGLRFDAGA